ncbi:MAG TPA: MFS transporter [Terriglobia bacterium]|nr:MFS transporter [Terriglobia bacterium]
MDFLIIGILFLLLFLGLADNQTIPAILPLLIDSLHITVEQAGLLAVFYSVAAAFASLVTGIISDHYGRRRFLIAGAGLFGFACWLAAHAASFTGLTLARGLTGLGAGTISTCSIAFAGDWFDYSIRGRALSWISTAYFAAPILGVPLAAQVAGRLGWRDTFYFFAILAAASVLIALRLPRDRRDSGPSSEKWKATFRACRSFFKRRDTGAGLVIAFLVSGGLYGFLYYIGQWLNSSFSVSTGTIGWVFMLGGLAALVSAPVAGGLSDRWGKRPVSIAANVLLAVSVAVVPFFTWGAGLLIVFGITSLGAAARQGPLAALMTELVPTAERGSFIALRNVSSQIGIGLVVLAGGAIYQRHGYLAVTTLCAAMTGVVAVLLATHIVEPHRVAARSRE